MAAIPEHLHDVVGRLRTNPYRLKAGKSRVELIREAYDFCKRRISDLPQLFALMDRMDRRIARYDAMLNSADYRPDPDPEAHDQRGVADVAEAEAEIDRLWQEDAEWHRLNPDESAQKDADGFRTDAAADAMDLENRVAYTIRISQRPIIRDALYLMRTTRRGFDLFLGHYEVLLDDMLDATDVEITESKRRNHRMPKWRRYIPLVHAAARKIAPGKATKRSDLERAINDIVDADPKKVGPVTVVEFRLSGQLYRYTNPTDGKAIVRVVAEKIRGGDSSKSGTMPLRSPADMEQFLDEVRGCYVSDCGNYPKVMEPES